MRFTGSIILPLITLFFFTTTNANQNCSKYLRTSSKKPWLTQPLSFKSISRHIKSDIQSEVPKTLHSHSEFLDITIQNLFVNLEKHVNKKWIQQFPGKAKLFNKLKAEAFYRSLNKNISYEYTIMFIYRLSLILDTDRNAINVNSDLIHTNYFEPTIMASEIDPTFTKSYIMRLDFTKSHEEMMFFLNKNADYWRQEKVTRPNGENSLVSPPYFLSTLFEYSQLITNYPQRVAFPYIGDLTRDQLSETISNGYWPIELTTEEKHADGIKMNPFSFPSHDVGHAINSLDSSKVDIQLLYAEFGTPKVDRLITIEQYDQALSLLYKKFIVFRSPIKRSFLLNMYFDVRHELFPATYRPSWGEHLSISEMIVYNIRDKRSSSIFNAGLVEAALNELADELEITSTQAKKYDRKMQDTFFKLLTDSINEVL